MSGFQLDTSGSVFVHTEDGYFPIRWSDLTPIAQGYVEAMFAAAISVGSGAHTYNSVLQLGFFDLAPATVALIIGDCERWREAYPNTNQGEQGGASFWRCRQEQLVQRPDFPPLTPYLAEDGRIYLREAA